MIRGTRRVPRGSGELRFPVITRELRSLERLPAARCARSLALLAHVLTSLGFYERLVSLVFRALVRSFHSLTRTPTARPLLVPPEAISGDRYEATGTGATREATKYSPPPDRSRCTRSVLPPACSRHGRAGTPLSIQPRSPCGATCPLSCENASCVSRSSAVVGAFDVERDFPLGTPPIEPSRRVPLVDPEFDAPLVSIDDCNSAPFERFDRPVEVEGIGVDSEVCDGCYKVSYTHQ